mmetsp:Transcript_12650/g.41701  ORF Transcript_12650/g.41701 Transcript_12650/m.41701 type:complete len:331 (+) Transcript_12650:50-1042(+)
MRARGLQARTAGAQWHSCDYRAPPPRSGACAAPLGTGSASMLMFGGYAEAEAGDRSCVADTWLMAAEDCALVECDGPTPRARLCSAAATVGSDVFMFGGWDSGEEGTGGEILDDVWVFSGREWRELPARVPGGPTSRHVACATGDGRVLLHNHRCSASVLVFDAETGSFHEQPTRGTAPSARGLHVAFVAGNEMLVALGADKFGSFCSDAFALNLDTYTWREVTGGGGGVGPTARAGACAAATGAGDGVVLGGAQPSRSGGLEACADVAWRLCPERGWSELELVGGAAPEPRNAAVAAALSGGAEDGILFSGGWVPFQRTYADSWVLRLS